jgi:transcription initiation factor IIE alpha subunit
MENKESINKQNEENAGKKIAFTCPFCREPVPATDSEYLRQLQARCLKMTAMRL